jgi:5'-AMP-activated protein kinase regulatory beta subunit
MGNAQTIERPKGGQVQDMGLNLEEIGPASINLDKRNTEREERKDSYGEGKDFSFSPERKQHHSNDSTSGAEDKEFCAGSGSEVGSWPATAQSGAASRGYPTIFKYSGTGKDVYVCGSFNNWEKIRMVKSQKDFLALIDLPAGKHQYKFLVDDEWTHDPNNPSLSNEMGSKNNYITIQQDDFDAFTALDMDSKAANKGHRRYPESDEWAQDVPSLHMFENRSGPPILPPHLLQVILNKDTPLSCEPTLLPEPNHVMINHLYALSIKDGVMVLSSTQRYRKKYVTTLLYKPIEGAA